MYRLIRSVLLAAATTGSLLVVGTPASASATTGAPAVTAEMASTQVKPPRIKQVRYTCHPENAIVSLKLRNPNKVELSWQVRLSNDDLQEAQAVTLAGKTAERVEFHGIPDGEFSIQVLDDLGETVATDEVAVECPPPAH
jgi:hypothetical protein